MMPDRCKPACFKAYDIRGQVPGQLDEDLARRIGLAAARAVGTGRWAVGWDCRLSSPGLAAALAGGLADGGVDVLELGLCGTEQVYHAVFSLGLAGGIMVTGAGLQSYAAYPGNADLFLNALHWLTNDAERISVSAQKAELPRLTRLKNDGWLTFWRVFLVGTWPGLVLVVGGCVWLFRRR